MYQATTRKTEEELKESYAPINMCSTGSGLSHVMFLSSSPQPSNLISTSQDDLDNWCIALTFVARLTAYISLFALLVIVIYMILRHLWDLDTGSSGEEASSTETSPLWQTKIASISYGTCEDLETGERGRNNSSEELYDRKICIICFDEERNCFFVPCGHCATCYGCAQRIFNGDNKTCPVCRRFIGKVRKLFSS